MSSTSLNVQNEFDYFNELHNTFKENSEKWLFNRLLKYEGIDDKKAECQRNLGNKCFAKKDYDESYQFYTKSLCYACRKGVNYGLALANRSALLYELGEFENCLKDIELCLNSEYPKKLYPKLLLRKCYCLHRLKRNNSDELKQCIGLAMSTIESCEEISPKQKETFIQKFNNLGLGTATEIAETFSIDLEIPPLRNGENENFVFASSSIELQFTTDKGRHVVANDNLKCGDVLFVEKAFFTAPILPKDVSTQCLDRCYNCLKLLRSSIPCETCVVCLYCNEDCRQNSWISGHKWECVGMQSNLWYKFGVGFGAFKAVCKGIRSKFSELTPETMKPFGNKEDNYPYFNSLLSHLKTNQLLDFMVKIASRIVLYLEQCTTFFDDIEPIINSTNVTSYIGGLLVRHMCQIQCNGSIIEHWNFNRPETVPYGVSPVASGMFPSISMMNHSCKPNITIYYVRDIAIVKALCDINKNDEIFNCYGVAYNNANRLERQNHLKTIYNFTCSCVICSDATKTTEPLNNWKCPYCSWEYSFKNCERCKRCKKELKDVSSLHNEACELFIETNTSLDAIKKSQEIGERVFTKNHPYFTRLYEAFYKHYLKIADLNNALKYIKLLVELESEKLGETSRSVGIQLLDILKDVFHFTAKGNLKIADVEDEIESLKKRCISILQLYYPLSQDTLNKCITIPNYTVQE